MIENGFLIFKSISILLLWAFAAISSGTTLLNLVPSPNGGWSKKYHFEYGLSAFLIGLLVTILLSIALMASIGLSRATASALFLFLLLIGIPSVRKMQSSLRSAIHFCIRDFKKHNLLTGTGLLMFCVLVTVLLLRSLLPPWSNDDLIYHIWQPLHGKYVLAIPSLGELYSWMPRNIETVFFFLRVISGDFVAAAMFQIMIFVAVMCVIANYFFSYVEDVAVSFIVSIMCVLTIHDFPRFLTYFLVDSGTHGFIVIFGVMLLAWIKDNNNIPALAAGGLAGGLALGSKYHALYYVFSLLLVLTPFFVKVILVKRVYAFKLIGILGGTIFLGCAFWYLRNAFCTGNPFYPMLFAHPGFTDVDMLGLKQQLATIGTPMNWWYIFAPFLSEYKPYRSFFFIPGFLSLGAFLFPKYRKEAVALSVFLILVILLNQLSYNGIFPRYHISLFVLGSFLGAYTIVGLYRRTDFLRNPAIFILVGITCFNFAVSLYALRPLTAVKHFIGKIPADEIYRRESLVAFEVNSMKDGQDYRILTICRPDLLVFFSFYRPPDQDLSMEMADIARNNQFDGLNNQEIREYFRATGVTHFLTVSDEAFAVHVASRTTLEEFLRIYRVRRSLIENSRYIPLTSSTEHALYELGNKAEAAR